MSTTRDNQAPRGETGPWTTLKHALAILLFGSACVSLGYNWHEVTAVGMRLDAQIATNAEEHRTFATRELVEAEQRNIQRQLDELKQLLTELLRRMDGRR
jgi:Tfp pilus assembly protein PilO